MGREEKHNSGVEEENFGNSEEKGGEQCRAQSRLLRVAGRVADLDSTSDSLFLELSRDPPSSNSSRSGSLPKTL